MQSYPCHSGKARAPKVALITLGCAKNQVDSEVMLGVLRQNGFAIVADIEQAEIAVVNTCGFLGAAVKEGIDLLLEIARLKERGLLRRVVAVGCMVERYGKDLVRSLPEIDDFVSADDILQIAEILRNGGGNQRRRRKRGHFLYDHRSPRILGQAKHTAYVKIAEGCDRSCSFCILPQIRGPFRSRRPQSVLRECRSLAVQGVREVNLIAQDLTSYGRDLGGAARAGGLAGLIRALDRAQSVPWIRLLYAYPVGVSDELVREIMSLPSVCEYLDLPLQHVSERVLRRMLRPLGRYSSRRLVERILSRAPELNLRTTFMVGFPGETEADVEQLESFIAEGHFSSVGVFAYSAEEGAGAFDFKPPVPKREITGRYRRLMLAQQKANAIRLKKYKGKVLPVLCEGPHPESELLLAGRTRFQAPEVDGMVIINQLGKSGRIPAQGEILDVRITDVAGYDLVGAIK